MNRIIGAIIACIAILGIGQAPASANTSGNYAQPTTYYSCGSNYAGHVEIHYNHTGSPNHAETAYGSYGDKDAGSGNLYRVKTYISGVAINWTLVSDTNPPYPQTNTWNSLFTAPTVSTGRSKWIVYILNTDGTTNTCTIGGDGTILFGLP